MENLVDAFITALGELAPGIETTVDALIDPNGETFIDIVGGGFATAVSYRPALGFGIYITPGTFGQRPDEVFRSARKAAQRISQLRDAFEKGGVIKPMTLTEMRVLAGFTQVEVATALSIRQPSVQRIEKRDNVQVETLARHVHAMGGRLVMSVVFEDMEARLDLPTLKEVG